jgi:DNA repair exonuclease SbcCD ATPase subunit
MKRKPSDKEIINFFFEALPRYEKSIDCFEDRLNQLRNRPPACIYSPVIIRQFRRWELNYLKKRGNDIKALEKAIAPLDARFRAVRKAHEKEYLHQMLESFRELIQDYHPEFVLKDRYYFENFLERTDDIEAIRAELNSFMDINKELEEIQKKLELFTVYLPDTIKKTTYSPDDYIEAPTEIWWRHLVEKYGEPAD